MERYIEQLLADIVYATENVNLPFVERELELHDWISDEEENKIAPPVVVGSLSRRVAVVWVAVGRLTNSIKKE